MVQELSVIITSCEACHPHANCHTAPVTGHPGEDVASESQSVSCVCKSGFTGDGLTCSPLLAHAPPAPHLRARRAALTSSSNQAHVTFTCGFYQCPPGQDCLTINGVQQCADPCQTYTVLNDPWRATNNPSSPKDRHCDRFVAWDGWYRMFVGNASVSMPNKCVEQFMCGTQAPLWLAFPNPQLSDGSQPIHVKACPGNYYVYKFVTPPGCYFAYCAATNHHNHNTATNHHNHNTATNHHNHNTATNHHNHNTATNHHNHNTATNHHNTATNHHNTATNHHNTATNHHNTATNHHNTATNHHNHNTATNHHNTATNHHNTATNHHNHNTATNHHNHNHNTSALEVGLVKAHLAAIGLDSSSAHLADPRCSAHQEHDGTVWYQVERREGSCGTTLRTNGSHAIYSNSLFVYPVGNVTFVRPLSVPFSCSYPLETDSSLGVAIRPYLAVKSAAVGQGSKVKASMTLFHNANYTEPYAMGPVTMAVGSVLHVGVSVDEKETERFVVVLDDCYATHSSKPADLMRYYLIQNGCPSDRRQVTVDESGLSRQARFSALLFLFQGDYRDIYLHCSLNLCDQRSSSCSPGPRVRM
ncbi:pancreatic secretory granule membrane major glycoprotein GP2-like [Osmerus mordax]|uniref:pancreatic secretory granule membrane major glycoprotein GP2-like n=1 Tax=Osmerus mordax TaxID=8014 RepID=UPI00350ED57C